MCVTLYRDLYCDGGYRFVCSNDMLYLHRRWYQRGLVYVGKAPLGLSFNSYSKSNSICCFSNDSVVDNSIDDMAIPRYHNLGRLIIQNNTAVLGSFRPETRLFWYAHEGGRMP